MPATAEKQSREPAVVPIPPRGRIWIILALAITVGLNGYAIVSISTQEAGDEVVHLSGISEAQEIFGGVPQEGDRFGSADAPVTIQIFNDLQCSSCRDDFLGTIRGLANGYARPGDVKLLYRHYSNSENVQQLGFYGAEAAAAQGYGWQYLFLFFRNPDEAERFGIDEDYLDTIAGGIEELNEPEWLEYLEDNGGSDGAISKQLQGYNELGENLSIRTGQAMIVNGPGGTQTLQDSPSLAEIEAAIEAAK
jgi:protein-disulfide isomerase